MPPERPNPAHGVFETLRLAGGSIQALEAHLERLAASVRELYCTSLTDEPRRLLAQHAAGLGEGEHRLRIDAVPDDAARRTDAVPDDAARRTDAVPDGTALRFETTSSALRPEAPAPVRLHPATVPGGLGPHKWRDRSLLDSLGTDPVPLLVDEDGSVLEAAWANVWLLRGDRLATPPSDGRILPGVTRGLLLQNAPELGLAAEQRPIALADLGAADAILLTSALRLAVAAGVGSAPAREPPAVARIRQALASLPAA